MSDGKHGLKERWDELSGPQKIGIVSGTALFLLIAYLALSPASSNYRGNRINVNEPLKKAELLVPRARDRTVEELGGELTQQAKSIDNLGKRMDRMSGEQKLILGRLDEVIKNQSLGTGDGGVTEEFIKELRTLRERVDGFEAQVELGGGMLSAPVDPMGMGEAQMLPAISGPGFASETFYEEEAKTEPPKILVVGGDEGKGDRGDKALKTDPVPYLTSSSMFEGQLLNGMDAPTDQSAKQNPVPAVIRIKTEAILPSLYNIAEVQECFISVAGYGDLSDERAKMRTEMLSCVVSGERPGDPARVIEAKVDGYIVGEDGRVGMRGRLVSKQGQLLARTMLAGVFSGLGEAVRPQSVQGIDLNPGSRVQTQRYDASTIGQSGLARGLSETSRSISDYYLKLADQMMPVVEIDAGRKVTVVLLKGVELK